MGTLYVVATPIGNLEDITLRAIRILKEVNAIACEDSRVTRTLLHKYDIRTPLIIYHQHSRSDEIIKRLKRNENIALVTDAGTPGIQDPGGKLVREALSIRAKVVPVPGGISPNHRLKRRGHQRRCFLFCGFPAQKTGSADPIFRDSRTGSANGYL